MFWEFRPTSSKLQSGVFSEGREEEGGRVAAFGGGWRDEKYGTTHALFHGAKCRQSDTTRRSPGVWSWMYDSNLYTAELRYQSEQLNLSAKPGSHSRQQI